MPQISKQLLEGIAEHLTPLDRMFEAFDTLVRDSSVVVLGSASQGCKELFYHRASLTKRLVEEHGFSLVALDGSSRAAFRANRYIRGEQDDHTARDALVGFEVFPDWVWANTEMCQFLDWLKEFNSSEEPEKRVRLYGLDLYGLFDSMNSALSLLGADDQTVVHLKRTFADLDRFREHGTIPSSDTSSTIGELLSRQTATSLALSTQEEYASILRSPHLSSEEKTLLESKQEALEGSYSFYRSLFGPPRRLWNFRDRAMFDVLVSLVGEMPDDGKAVVWTTNLHAGDSRTTEMGKRGEISLGQLARERFGKKAKLIDLTTFSGTVTTSDEWGGSVGTKELNTAVESSYEYVFHETGIPDGFMVLHHPTHAVRPLREPRLERNIGIIYAPETERLSHYFTASMYSQFDGIVYIEQTSALTSL